MKTADACLVLVLLESRVVRQLLACLTSHTTIFWSLAPLTNTEGWLRDQARERTAVSAWWPDLHITRLIFLLLLKYWLDV